MTRQILNYISIHALVKRATVALKVEVGSEPNFNPRPRKEGDSLSLPPLSCQLNISIHALVKRATSSSVASAPSQRISIHALVKRATSQRFVWCLVEWYFNPRPRKEGDAILLFSQNGRTNFNPRPRKEGDVRYSSLRCTRSLIFQSTPS